MKVRRTLSARVSITREHTLSSERRSGYWTRVRFSRVNLPIHSLLFRFSFLLFLLGIVITLLHCRCLHRRVSVAQGYDTHWSSPCPLFMPAERPEPPPAQTNPGEIEDVKIKWNWSDGMENVALKFQLWLWGWHLSFLAAHKRSLSLSLLFSSKPCLPGREQSTGIKRYALILSYPISTVLKYAGEFKDDSNYTLKHCLVFAKKIEFLTDGAQIFAQLYLCDLRALVT